MRAMTLCWLALSLALVPPAIAQNLAELGKLVDETELVASVEAFFQTSNRAQRITLARRIEADPDFKRGRLQTLLHRADLFPALKAGRHEVRVTLPNDETRPLVFRIPEDYDHRRPWPVILALHGSTGDGDWAIRYVMHVLGERAGEFVIAAPTDYKEGIIHHDYWPPLGEIPAFLLKIRQSVHADSDRIYLTGYSMGGHATWTRAVMHPDDFAAALPLAGSFSIWLPERLWPAFIPNIERLPLTAVWGAGDIYNADGSLGPERGIAGVNRRFSALADKHEIPYRGIELPAAAHKDVIPPDDAVRDWLQHRRVHTPPRFQFTFRHEYQADVYWIEVHAWAGDQWTDRRRTVKLPAGQRYTDENMDDAVAKMFRSLLGQVRGEIKGQHLDVYRRKVKEMTVWIHAGMIDWDQPVVLECNGREVFNDRLKPRVYVALSQAARTWDFDRLRWAGLRFRSGRGTNPVDAETEFPTLAELLKPDG